MDLDVIAEGVETRQQQAELSAMGCRFAQGFLFARPLEEHDACDYVKGVAESVGRAASG
jgi:EAL domain-containing protein (putative c-di-GMP-specific phosphodiesterase class I)